MYRECIVVFRVKDGEEVFRVEKENVFVTQTNHSCFKIEKRVMDKINFNTQWNTLFMGSFDNFYIKYV
jgi:hypothetical protein